MRYTNILVLLGLMFVFLLSGCSSSSDDGGDTPAQSQSCVNITGDWQVTATETIPASCDAIDATALAEDEEDEEEEPVEEVISEFRVTQDGCGVTFYVPGEGKYDGVVSGNNVNWSGQNGSVWFNYNVNASGNSFNGTLSWTLSDGFERCSGAFAVSGTRYH